MGNRKNKKHPRVRWLHVSRLNPFDHRNRIMNMPNLIIIQWSWLGLLLTPLLAHGQEPVLKMADLDPAGCRSFTGNQEQPAALKDVAATIGLSRPDQTAWSAGNTREAATFHYRIGFRRPAPLG